MEQDGLFQRLLNDYDTYDQNSNILVILNKLVIEILLQSSCLNLIPKLLV